MNRTSILKSALIFLLLCVCVAAGIIAFWFLAGNFRVSDTNRTESDILQIEESVNEQDFRLSEEARLRELLPENIIDTDEEISSELRALEELKSQSTNETGLDQLNSLQGDRGGEIDSDVEAQLRALQ